MNCIVAVDKNWAIGYQGGLLCHLSEDLKYFKRVTTGHTVVMGRSTLESLPGKKGLPNRRNIVITHQEDFQADRIDLVFHSVDELLEWEREHPCQLRQDPSNESPGTRKSEDEQGRGCDSRDAAGSRTAGGNGCGECSGEPDSEIFIMGGAQIYQQMLPYCDTFYVTKIDEEFPADCWISNLDEDAAIEPVWQSEEMEEKGIRYRFMRYERR